MCSYYWEFMLQEENLIANPSKTLYGSIIEPDMHLSRNVTACCVDVPHNYCDWLLTFDSTRVFSNAFSLQFMNLSVR